MTRCIKIFLLFMLLAIPVYATDIDNISDMSEDSISLINENFRRLAKLSYSVATDADLALKITIPTVGDAGDLLYRNANGTWTSTTGNNSLGSMFYYNGTAVTAFTAGTSGQALVISGGVPTWSAPSSGGMQVEIFTSNGTFTAASDLTFVTMCGGGGGGQGAPNGINGGHGGSGAASIIRAAYPTNNGTLYQAYVGAGGAGAAPAWPGVEGSSGGKTIFGLAGGFSLTVAGGYANQGITPAPYMTLSAVGTTPGFGFQGYAGGGSGYVGGRNGAGGGGSYLGRGAEGKTGVGHGNNATSYGGGGGGGYSDGLGTPNGGGNGGSGIIILEYYQ